MSLPGLRNNQAIVVQTAIKDLMFVILVIICQIKCKKFYPVKNLAVHWPIQDYWIGGSICAVWPIFPEIPHENEILWAQEGVRLKVRLNPRTSSGSATAVHARNRATGVHRFLKGSMLNMTDSTSIQS